MKVTILLGALLLYFTCAGVFGGWYYNRFPTSFEGKRETWQAAWCGALWPVAVPIILGILLATLPQRRSAQTKERRQIISDLERELDLGGDQ